MNLNEVKIIADSSADLLELEGINFSSAPLKISTDEAEFIDNAELDIKGMTDYLASYKGASRSSCPSPDDWLSAFGDAKYIFCIAITSGLSGMPNIFSALLSHRGFRAAIIQLAAPRRCLKKLIPIARFALSIPFRQARS